MSDHPNPDPGRPATEDNPANRNEVPPATDDDADEDVEVVERETETKSSRSRSRRQPST